MLAPHTRDASSEKVALAALCEMLNPASVHQSTDVPAEGIQKELFHPGRWL